MSNYDLNSLAREADGALRAKADVSPFIKIVRWEIEWRVAESAGHPELPSLRNLLTRLYHRPQENNAHFM